ncbi:putative F-box/LRR-repeat protein 23 [Heracleum sosnowskyi]|uniref:F-box/LRR-repeat protein 23 n=1 Tax=Heracleum sosnowskyi TaxID=360622 RepID=A0AAD8IBE3_9APIA|nr:putative F-box/LRR-repeat protein 23 [Heracleum sosnowskyi]
MIPTSIRVPPPANRSRNWQELPVELTTLILKHLGTVDMLLSARKVCKTWRLVCSDPTMYRVVDLWFTGDPYKVNFNVCFLARQALQLSRGQMIAFSISYFADDYLLRYISQRSRQLRCLTLASCNITPEGLSQMVRTLPLLDELHLHCIWITKQAIQDIGQCCPHLRTFRLNYPGRRELYFPYDKNAKAIAESMPGLCHLQLFGNRISRNGLLAIIDKCSHLESLDIRCCFGCTKLGPDLLRRLYQQMSRLWLPYDSTKGCGLLDIYDLGSLMTLMIIIMMTMIIMNLVAVTLVLTKLIVRRCQCCLASR